MDWWVYLVRCADESLYCGIALDPEARLLQHNGREPGGARYTAGRRPVRLVWREAHPDRSSAARREAEIKKLSRERKEALLS